MLDDWNRESKKVGLKMNKSKTMIMFNDKVTPQAITIDGKALEQVDEYLGQLIKLKKDHDSKIKCRIKIGWMTFS